MHSIIMGFPAVGKTTTTKRSINNRFIDLDATKFMESCYFANLHFDPDLNCYQSYCNPDWFKFYCNVAIDLAEDHDVFISVTPEILDYMKLQDKTIRDSIIVIYPSLLLKDKWRKKMKDRYEKSHLLEDRRAYEYYICDNFDKTIKKINTIESFSRIQLNSIKYPPLSSIISNLQIFKSVLKQSRVQIMI